MYNLGHRVTNFLGDKRILVIREIKIFLAGKTWNWSKMGVKMWFEIPSVVVNFFSREFVKNVIFNREWGRCIFSCCQYHYIHHRPINRLFVNLKKKLEFKIIFFELFVLTWTRPFHVVKTWHLACTSRENVIWAALLSPRGLLTLSALFLSRSYRLASSICLRISSDIHNLKCLNLYTTYQKHQKTRKRDEIEWEIHGDLVERSLGVGLPTAIYNDISRWPHSRVVTFYIGIITGSN